jgi:hypothetical protein
MLISYIRDTNRVPFGVVVALNKDLFGVSICSPRDRFNKAMGIKIAEGRALLKAPAQIPKFRTINGCSVHKIVQDAITKMGHRAERYFK